LRAAVTRLRDVASSEAAGPVRGVLKAAAESIEQNLEQMRKQHQLTVSQFQVEIRMLHQRIESLESAVPADLAGHLLNHWEIDKRIRGAADGSTLLLAKVGGIRLAEMHYGREGR
jgi:hypothetical protein